MKKIVLVSGVMSMLMIMGLAASAAAPPANFSGTWVFDKSKSEGLPRMWENATGIELVVTQDDKQITVETKVSGGEFAMPSQALTYKLDGSETTAEMSGRMPGKATSKAKWKDDGKALDLTTVRQLNFQGNDVTITTKETWELSGDGKVLKVHRVSESPRGTQDSKLTFNKK